MKGKEKETLASSPMQLVLLTSVRWLPVTALSLKAIAPFLAAEVEGEGLPPSTLLQGPRYPTQEVELPVVAVAVAVEP